MMRKIYFGLILVIWIVAFIYFYGALNKHQVYHIYQIKKWNNPSFIGGFPTKWKTSIIESISPGEVVQTLQEERQNTLNAACLRFQKNKISSYSKTSINGENLVSKHYKVSTCNIFKCGYSAWFRAIYVMEDIFTVDDYLNHKIGGDRLIAQSWSTITYKAIKNETARKKLWNEATNVITVRNPFSRLVSAYYDKMLTTSEGHTNAFKAISRQINKRFRHLRHNITERNQADDGTATFEDFVNSVVQSKGPMNSHWMMYYDSCKPCEIEYNYIVKFETLNNDMEYLKQKLNISRYHRQAFFPKSNYKTNWDLVEKTFEAIPKELGLKLYEKYRIDFEMFGYEKPDWLL